MNNLSNTNSSGTAVLARRYYSCFFTGHRFIANNVKNELYTQLIREIRTLIEQNGVDTFICGGAIGFDALAAKAVIAIKKLYPHIKLRLYIPCFDHYIKWKQRDKDEWKYIHSLADSCEYITKGPYVDGCMQKRNIRMADDSFYCIAYCLRNSTGTGATLKYAKSKSCTVVNLADLL